MGLEIRFHNINMFRGMQHNMLVLNVILICWYCSGMYLSMAVCRYLCVWWSLSARKPNNTFIDMLCASSVCKIIRCHLDLLVNISLVVEYDLFSPSRVQFICSILAAYCRVIRENRTELLNNVEGKLIN